MLVKTVRGRTTSEALARVREVLGAGAVVLETRRVTGGVEIVAATERPGTGGGGAPVPAPATRPLGEPAERLRDDLLAFGFGPVLAERIARAAEANLDEERLADPLARLAYARRAVGLWLAAAEPPAPADGVRVLAVVGAPGVGKTTTLAKVAAREAIAGGRRVVLASCDDQRLGGAEQVEGFARVLGVPFRLVRDRRDLDRARIELPPGTLLLLDTPGIARNDREGMDRLAGILAGVSAEEVELLLAADRDGASLADTVRRFRRLRPGRLGATRLDEAVRPGALVTAAARARLPLLHLGNGPRVPDDLELADPARLAAWAVPSPRGAREEEAR